MAEIVVRWTEVVVSLSLFYILFSLGLTLIFGFHEVVNFAHGAFYTIGAYVGLFAYGTTGNFGVALVTAVIVVMIIAAIFERLLVSRLLGTDPANSFLATFAFGLTLMGGVKLLAGGTFQVFPVPEALTGTLSAGGISIATYRLFFIAVSIALIALVYLLLARTRMGIIIRGGTSNRTAVEVFGINVGSYFTLLFALGSGLAAIAGVLIAPSLSVYPGMGDEIILWAFVIIIIGGLGSFKGAIFGGGLIGLLHGMGSLVVGQYVTILTFGILILLLLFKPAGLFGRKAW